MCQNTTSYGGKKHWSVPGCPPKTLITLSVATMLLGGCASQANLVQPSVVTMDKTGATFAADDTHCRRIAETRDYFGEAMGRAVVKGLVGGIAGGIGGAVIGHQFGNASAGAVAGGVGAGTGLALQGAGLQEETATTVWAKCMVNRGHPVYSVAWH